VTALFSRFPSTMDDNTTDHVLSIPMADAPEDRLACNQPLIERTGKGLRFTAADELLVADAGRSSRLTTTH
jgi:hypothetical protein